MKNKLGSFFFSKSVREEELYFNKGLSLLINVVLTSRYFLIQSIELMRPFQTLTDYFKD